jgi:hypothetical protein
MTSTITESTQTSIRKKLFNISSNLCYISYLQTYCKKLKRYTINDDAQEALKYYHMACKPEWTKEEEEEIKAYMIKVRLLKDTDLFLEQEEYVRKYYK